MTNETNAVSSAVESAKQRATRYRDIDGLPLILLGLPWLLIGLQTTISDKLSKFFGFIGGLLGMVIVGAIAIWLYLFDREILEQLKSSLTYRRTGYVPAPPSSEDVLCDDSRPPILRSLFSPEVVCAIPIFTVWMMLNFGIAVSFWLRLATLVPFGVTMVLLGRKRGRPIEGIAFLVASFAYCILARPRTSVDFSVVFGAGLILVAAWRFALYLRRNLQPKPTES